MMLLISGLLEFSFSVALADSLPPFGDGSKREPRAPVDAGCRESRLEPPPVPGMGRI